MGDEHALLIDRGLFQSADTSSAGRAGAGSLAPDFSLDGKALVATHAHVDRTGRIPCVLENAFKLGFSHDQKQVKRAFKLSELPIVALTQTAQPAIAIAGNGMCSSWRIVNYLKAMVSDER